MQYNEYIECCIDKHYHENNSLTYLTKGSVAYHFFHIFDYPIPNVALSYLFASRLCAQQLDRDGKQLKSSPALLGFDEPQFSYLKSTE